MRRVSVLMEVGEDTYNAIVEPRKKAKTFAKLMCALLEGYMNDGYIQAFVDGVLDDMKKSTASSLDKVIADMHVSLANLGLYTDDLKSTSQAGKDMFSEKAEEVGKSSEGEDVKYGVLEELMREVLEQNKEILGFLHSGIPINSDTKTKLAEASSGIISGVSEVGESVFDGGVFDQPEEGYMESAVTEESLCGDDGGKDGVFDGDDLVVGDSSYHEEGYSSTNDSGVGVDLEDLLGDLGIDDDEGLVEVPAEEEDGENSFDRDKGQAAAENYADNIMSTLLAGNMMTM